MKTPSVFTLSALTLLCFALSASAMPISNIVKNGGFESGGLFPWDTSGNTGSGATTNAAANNGAFGVGHDSAHSGNFGAFAGPTDSLGFLTQNLRTVRGSNYELSFWMEGNQSDALSATTPNHPVEFEVFWGGQLLYRTLNPPTTYTEFTFTGLTARCSNTKLKFGFRDDFGVFHLDDVTAGISRIPEAFTTLWLALPVFFVFAFAHFSRKRVQLQLGAQ